MKDLLAAGRYAQALFELARPLKKDEEVEAQLEAFSAALSSSPDTEKYLNNPYVPLAIKQTALKRLYPDEKGGLADFFTLLLEKNRFYLVHEVTRSFKRIADEAQGQAVAELTTASPLGADLERRIVAQLERIAGCTLTVRKMTDPSLIGGISVRINNRVLDGSVRNKIDLLKKELTKIAAV